MKPPSSTSPKSWLVRTFFVECRSSVRPCKLDDELAVTLDHCMHLHGLTRMEILGEKHDQKRKVVRICVEALLGSTEKGTVVVTRNPRQHAHMTFSLRLERNGRHLKPNFMHTAKMG
ncbi:hypothetical protein VNO77_27616 [Canavalia gladiata]|uniref:Uncharacterized protein n=1 Tax=Canavalia gladiata TaxID=3824 RepID=A0AAN9Q6N1_CANGL